MKELRENFIGIGEVKNFEFKCLKQSEKAYLYEVNDIEIDNIHYETFEHKENKQFDCVSYPKSNSFGLWAFTYKNYDDALVKYNYLNSKEKEVKDVEMELVESDEESEVGDD